MTWRGYSGETALGASANLAARKKVMDLAQTRQIDAVLVSELSRWGRSTQDLLATLHRLAGWKVSVVAMNGMTFELDTPHGRMMATVLAGIAQFERDLISERVKSGLAAAKARGKKLGRRPGQRPKSDRLAPNVLQAVSEGRSYRWIARDLGISKNTVFDVVQPAQAGRIKVHSRSAQHQMRGQLSVNVTGGEDQMLGVSFRPLPESTTKPAPKPNDVTKGRG